VQFPATRVNAFANPISVRLSVPDIIINPDGDYVQIDSIRFDPDQHVFTAHDSTGGDPPWTVLRNQTKRIVVGFHPRAPKPYFARMRLYMSHPCKDYFDSTVLITGSGFAPPAEQLLALRDSTRIDRDTMRLTTCDTLVL